MLGKEKAILCTDIKREVSHRKKGTKHEETVLTVSKEGKHYRN